MSKHLTVMTIDDAEHLSEKQKAEIIASYPPHQLDARTQGRPAMGSGLVYPIPESEITVEPFPIPPYWAKINALDIGWTHPTAAVQLAHDRDNDIIYVTKSYRRKQATPVEHCATLKQWGAYPWSWPPDANAKDKRSGEIIRLDYANHGLNMLNTHAQFEDGGRGIEAGVSLILTRMQTKRFFVFSNCRDWFQEFGMYHRKEGIITEVLDDLMDATRYGVMMLRFALDDFLISGADEEDLDPHDDGRTDGGY